MYYSNGAYHVAPNPATPGSLMGLSPYHVNWAAFLGRALVRSAILWLPIHFVGGVGAIRAIGTAAIAGGALTGLELAFDATNTLTTQAAAMAEGAADGMGAAPNVIDVDGYSYTPNQG